MHPSKRFPPTSHHTIMPGTHHFRLGQRHRFICHPRGHNITSQRPEPVSFTPRDVFTLDYLPRVVKPAQRSDQSATTYVVQMWVAGDPDIANEFTSDLCHSDVPGHIGIPGDVLTRMRVLPVHTGD